MRLPKISMAVAALAASAMTVATPASAAECSQYLLVDKIPAGKSPTLYNVLVGDFGDKMTRALIAHNNKSVNYKVHVGQKICGFDITPIKKMLIASRRR